MLFRRTILDPPQGRIKSPRSQKVLRYIKGGRSRQSHRSRVCACLTTNLQLYRTTVIIAYSNMRGGSIGWKRHHNETRWPTTDAQSADTINLHPKTICADTVEAEQRLAQVPRRSSVEALTPTQRAIPDLQLDSHGRTHVRLSVAERQRSATGASHPGRPHRHSACRLAPVRCTAMVGLSIHSSF